MTFILLIRHKEKKGERTHSVGHKGFIAEVEIKIYLIFIYKLYPYDVYNYITGYYKNLKNWLCIYIYVYICMLKISVCLCDVIKEKERGSEK